MLSASTTGNPEFSFCNKDWGDIEWDRFEGFEWCCLAMGAQYLTGVIEF